MNEEQKIKLEKLEQVYRELGVNDEAIANELLNADETGQLYLAERMGDVVKWMPYVENGAVEEYIENSDEVFDDSIKYHSLDSQEFNEKYRADTYITRTCGCQFSKHYGGIVLHTRRSVSTELLQYGDIFVFVDADGCDGDPVNSQFHKTLLLDIYGLRTCGDAYDSMTEAEKDEYMAKAEATLDKFYQLPKAEQVDKIRQSLRNCLGIKVPLDEKIALEDRLHIVPYRK